MAVGSDLEGEAFSRGPVSVAILLAHWMPELSLAIYAGVALVWIAPDPRIAKIYHV